MSLVAELRRRHVFKVGGAYVVIAWLVVQAASIAFPAFDAPTWVLRVFILILMLGFPIALVMAWAFEATPEGLRLEPAPVGNKRMALIASTLVVLALAWYFVGQPAVREAIHAPSPAAAPASASTATDAVPAAPASAPRKAIAVLPFVNMSADKDNEYFSDGISEELLNALVRVPGLGVASRTSSFAYKGSPLGAAAIAKELKVAHILEGSVRKSGNRVRITAQLIDASDDRHVWSETFDRELIDIFAIQDEIAKAIVAALQVRLDAANAAATVSVQADTQNMQAYDLYLKARELFIARRNLDEAVRLFERAVELDPQFARGYEGLGAVASVARSWGYIDRDYFAISQQATNRALALDPTLSMPWAVQSILDKQRLPVDYASVLANLEKSIGADPRNATALLWRAIAWIELGFFDRALADVEQCLALEPGYHNCRSHQALALLLSGDETAALAQFERTVANGAFASRNDHFVVPLLRRGDRTAAWLLLDSMDLERELRAIVVAALDHPEGPRPDSDTIKARFLASPESATLKVIGPSRLFLWLGDFDEVASADDRATTTIIAWERDPPSFRNSSAMKRKLTDLGVTAHWRKHGFPPQCRALGSDDFNCELATPMSQ